MITVAQTLVAFLSALPADVANAIHNITAADAQHTDVVRLVVVYTGADGRPASLGLRMVRTEDDARRAAADLLDRLGIDSLDREMTIAGLADGPSRTEVAARYLGVPLHVLERALA